jgi:hypothetical protein
VVEIEISENAALAGSYPELYEHNIISIAKNAECRTAAGWLIIIQRLHSQLLFGLEELCSDRGRDTIGQQNRSQNG